jgi:hypothetical protein
LIVSSAVARDQDIVGLGCLVQCEIDWRSLCSVQWNLITDFLRKQALLETLFSHRYNFVGCASDLLIEINTHPERLQ